MIEFLKDCVRRLPTNFWDWWPEEGVYTNPQQYNDYPWNADFIDDLNSIIPNAEGIYIGTFCLENIAGLVYLNQEMADRFDVGVPEWHIFGRDEAFNLVCINKHGEVKYSSPMGGKEDVMDQWPTLHDFINSACDGYGF